MIKKIFWLLKRIFFAFFILYGLNYLISAMHIYIPINFITVSIVSFLGLPGLASLIIMFFIVK